MKKRLPGEWHALTVVCYSMGVSKRDTEEDEMAQPGTQIKRGNIVVTQMSGEREEIEVLVYGTEDTSRKPEEIHVYTGESARNLLVALAEMITR